MQTTFHFSQARVKSDRAIGLRERLARSIHLGGELLALASLAVALTTSLVAMAAVIGH
jgi:hypothetical protein